MISKLVLHDGQSIRVNSPVVFSPRYGNVKIIDELIVEDKIIGYKIYNSDGLIGFINFKYVVYVEREMVKE